MTDMVCQYCTICCTAIADFADICMQQHGALICPLIDSAYPGVHMMPFCYGDRPVDFLEAQWRELPFTFTPPG